MGNILMDKALQNLYRSSVISKETYEGAVKNPETSVKPAMTPGRTGMNFDRQMPYKR
jgi:hypothetical protein